MPAPDLIGGGYRFSDKDMRPCSKAAFGLPPPQPFLNINAPSARRRAPVRPLRHAACCSLLLMTNNAVTLSRLGTAMAKAIHAGRGKASNETSVDTPAVRILERAARTAGGA